MKTMLALSLRQMAGRRRLAIIIMLALVPVGLAVILNFFLGDDSDFTDEFVDGIVDRLLVSVILPIVVMALATSAFGNEIEDRTLNVLILKPISRFSIVLPKFISSVVVTGGLMGFSAGAVGIIALSDGGFRAVVAVVIATLVGVVTYAAIFTWAGLVSAKALGFALVYVFIWEGLLTSFLSGIRYLSVRGYMLSIMNGLDGETFDSLDRRVIEFPAAIGGAVIVTVLFVWLSVRRLNRMDVQ
jgi:ABC-2 type transport system permease protein